LIEENENHSPQISRPGTFSPIFSDDTLLEYTDHLLLDINPREAHRTVTLPQSEEMTKRASRIRAVRSTYYDRVSRCQDAMVDNNWDDVTRSS